MKNFIKEAIGITVAAIVLFGLSWLFYAPKTVVYTPNSTFVMDEVIIDDTNPDSMNEMIRIAIESQNQ